jgi:hypothetical protein
MRVSLSPAEADPPLVIDPNAVLAGAVSYEALQAVPRGHAELFQPLGGVQEQQLAVRASLYVRWQFAGSLAFEHLPGRGVSEGSNHWLSVTRCITNVKRYYSSAQPNKRLQLPAAARGRASGL